MSGATVPRPSFWRSLEWFLLGLAFAHHAADQYFLVTFGWDKVEQIAASRSLVESHGLTVQRPSSANLAEPLREPLYGWPPGYSLLIAPLLWATDNVWWSAYLVDLASSALFHGSWFVILRRLSEIISDKVRCALWTYWAIFHGPLVPLTSSDLAAVAFYSAAIAACIHLCSRQRAPTRGGIAVGFLAGCAAAIRFAYWPLAFIMPLVLALCAWRHKPGLWRAALASILIIAVALGLLVAVQTWNTGHATYLTHHYRADTKGFYWKQCLEIYPFPAGALGLDEVGNRASERLHLSSTWQRTLIWAMSCGILLVASWHAARLLIRSWPRDASSTTACTGLGFALLGVLSTLVTVAMLCYLSLRYPRLGEWTHVQSLRYYAPAFGFLAVALFATMSDLRVSPRSIKLLAWLLIAACLTTGVWRARRWWRIATQTYPRAEMSAIFDDGTRLLYDLIRERRRAGQEVLYVDDDFGRHTVALMAGAMTLPIDRCRNLQAHSARPLDIIFPRRANTMDWQVWAIFRGVRSRTANDGSPTVFLFWDVKRGSN